LLVEALPKGMMKKVAFFLFPFRLVLPPWERLPVACKTHIPGRPDETFACNRGCQAQRSLHSWERRIVLGADVLLADASPAVRLLPPEPQ